MAELLRLCTIGSVDDGKSTLIGRLLYDTKSILADQLSALERTSQARGEDELNLALLTDGLRAEREQGITIDVAYRYFTTSRRRFILADTLATSSTQETWSPGPQLRTLRWSSSMPAWGCSSSPGATRSWPACSVCRTSLSA